MDRPADPSFADRVRTQVQATRSGEVLTYGEVAREAGAPGAARAVGNVLAATTGLPWWRIVAADGRLAPGKEHEQARRLRAEGVRVDEPTGRVSGMGRRARPPA